MIFRRFQHFPSTCIYFRGPGTGYPVGGFVTSEFHITFRDDMAVVFICHPKRKKTIGLDPDGHGYLRGWIFTAAKRFKYNTLLVVNSRSFRQERPLFPRSKYIFVKWSNCIKEG